MKPLNLFIIDYIYNIILNSYDLDKGYMLKRNQCQISEKTQVHYNGVADDVDMASK